MLSSIDSPEIASQWLGDYASSSDRKGVAEFNQLVPSIVTSKLLPLLSQAAESNGTFQVSGSSRDNGDGSFNVGVAINAGGSSYDGEAVVTKAGSSYKLRDVTYLGFSGLGFLGQDIQQDLNNSSGSATPVTDADNQIISSSGFVRCD